jgi:YHS domain-containing protein/thiol-disulfide isomerase/thioredoxin
MRIHWFVLALSISLLSGQTARADLDCTTVWGHDFATAEAEAARLHRPLVVHFHATYCGPCKRMEKELLHTQQVLKTLDAGFVAVKVELPNPKVQARFKVSSMPTDLVLGPDGKVLYRSEGYEPDGSTRQKYINNISRIDKQFAQAGKRLPRTVPGADSRQPAVAINSGLAVPDRAVASGDKLVPQPSEPKKVDVPGETNSGAAPTTDEMQDGRPTTDVAQIQVAMDGYCPVTLRTTRTWKHGSKDFALEHDGQTYYFAAADKLAEFKANPEKFAPRLLGCDPVVLAESDLAVRGSTKFGAFYEGALFLFESAESRTKFKKTPTRYSQLKHALKPEDVKKLASTAGN